MSELDQVIEEIISLMQEVQDEELGRRKDWPVTTEIVQIRPERKPIWIPSLCERRPSSLLINYLILIINFVHIVYRVVSFLFIAQIS